MLSRRKLVHVDPDLGNQTPSGHPVETGNFCQTGDRFLKWCVLAFDLRLQLGQL